MRQSSQARDWGITPLAGAHPKERFGQKAASLALLLQNGIAVPPGFAIATSAFHRFLEANQLRSSISGHLGRVDFHNPGSVRQCSSQIQKIVADGILPEGLRTELKEFLGRLPSKKLIVRSSAVGEDGCQASFAGQLDSFECENRLESFSAALKMGWASLWSARCLFYQHQRKIVLEEMGIVVQELIEPELAGVLFTRAPGLQGGSRPEKIMIEYVPGQGSSLVSGQANPGRILVDRDGFRVEVDALPEAADGNGHAASALGHDAIIELAETAVRLEALMNSPQDIEWCLDHSKKMWFVQSRPITGSKAGDERFRCAKVAAAPGWRGPDGQRPSVLWSNVNVNENYPDPVTPLLYSIAQKSYYHYFKDLGRSFGLSKRRLAALEGEFQHIIGAQAGRIYYNLSSIYRTICTLPFGKKVAQYFDAFIGVTAQEDIKENHENRFGTTIALSSAVALGSELVMMAVTTGVSLFRATHRVERFERMSEEYLESCANQRKAPAPGLSRAELYREFTGFLDIRFHQWKDASIADAAAMFSYGLFNSFLKRVLRQGFQEGMINSLLMGIPDIVSALPAQAVWKIAALIRQDPEMEEAFLKLPAAELMEKMEQDPAFKGVSDQISRYARQWGFRCSGELMLSTPNLSENPTALLHVIKSYVSSRSPSPEEIAERQRGERLRVEEKIREAICPLRAIRSFHPLVRLFDRLEQWTHTSVALRERVRMKQARLYAQCRKTALGLGAHLANEGVIGQKEDVFFLKFEEIEQLFSGHEMLPGTVPAIIDTRKREMASVSAVTPPASLRLPWGEYFSAGGQPPSGEGPEAKPDGTKPVSRLKGVPACGGVATARARVLQSIMEADELRPGEILVTRQTDPGWGLVFPLIKGLVMERGGMLSHGAIISREFGIPAVVGIKEATSLISENQRITIDGDAGTVEIHR